MKTTFILISLITVALGFTACRVLVKEFDGTLDPARVPPIPALAGPLVPEA